MADETEDDQIDTNPGRKVRFAEDDDVIDEKPEPEPKAFYKSSKNFDEMSFEQVKREFE